MKNKVKRFFVYLNFLRLIIPIIPWLTDTQFREICKLDLKRIEYAVPDVDTLYGLLYALLYNMPYRAIYLYRLKKNHLPIKVLCSILLKNKRQIEIGGDIQPGFAIYHGQGSVIYCRSAGKNLSIYQNVTVGRNPSKKDDDGVDIPSIGDNVNIYAHAIVVGGITIGNNVDIGAGSVVLKDIPNNCVATGNPAKVIRYKQERD